MKSFNEFAISLNEAQGDGIVAAFNSEIDSRLKPFLKVTANDSLSASVTVVFLGAGKESSGTDHFNTRFSMFIMHVNRKFAFERMIHNKSLFNFRAPPARASKTGEEAATKLAKWFNKNADAFLEAAHNWLEANNRTVKV